MTHVALRCLTLSLACCALWTCAGEPTTGQQTPRFSGRFGLIQIDGDPLPVIYIDAFVGDTVQLESGELSFDAVALAFSASGPGSSANSTVHYTTAAPYVVVGDSFHTVATFTPAAGFHGRVWGDTAELLTPPQNFGEHRWRFVRTSP